LVVRVDFGRGYYPGGIRHAALIGMIFTTKQVLLSSSTVHGGGKRRGQGMSVSAVEC
jgi:hypothetical protein